MKDSIVAFVVRVLDAVADGLDRAVAEAKLFVARARVVALAVNTYLVAFAATAPLWADKLAGVLPAPVSERVTAILLALVGFATSASLVIRRSTEVVPEDRQILPLGHAPLPTAVVQSLRAPAPEERKRAAKNGGWHWLVSAPRRVVAKVTRKG